MIFFYEAADVVVMTDEPSKIPVAIKIARRTLSIARQNIAIALGVKGGILNLGALGIASIWAAWPWRYPACFWAISSSGVVD